MKVRVNNKIFEIDGKYEDIVRYDDKIGCAFVDCEGIEMCEGCMFDNYNKYKFEIID